VSELEPLFGFSIVLLFMSVLPAAVISWIWGGKAVFYVCAALGFATIAFLTWIALTAVFSAGMEGLAFVIWPALYLTVCFGAFLGYAIVRILKPT
jgi:hypothetical protein